jgi:transcriptional regulator with XRE-family HTH domain
MNAFAKKLRHDLGDVEARYAYADTVTNAFMAAQIKGLREARGLSQEELAELVGTKQSGISRIERSDYSTWKVETLRKLARAFGVRLRVRFESFGTLLHEVADFSDKSLLPCKFEDDPAFRNKVLTKRSRHPRRVRAVSGKRASQSRRLRALPRKPPVPQEGILPSRQEAASGGATNSSIMIVQAPTLGANNSVGHMGSGV